MGIMTTTITSRGQTVVPAGIRKAHHLEPETKLEWVDDGISIRVVPLGRDTIRDARGMFGKGNLRKALIKARKEDLSRE
jgi:bifunctional DNA-binding transcriptional regulator/antitoxin component of YhaV-PrlF toxin-antitoxin module